MQTKLKTLALIALLLVLFSCGNQEKKGEPTAESKPTVFTQPDFTYPQTQKDTTAWDTYFDLKVADPYRWLENDTAAAVKKWVEEQNAVTFGYLDKIPFRQKIKDRLSEIYNYARASAPFKEGDWYFYTRNSGLQNQAVLYYKKGLKGQEKVFIDPNQINKEGTSTFGVIGVSKDHKYAAIGRNDAGSDWQLITVREIESNKETGDTLWWCKFTDAAWYNDGFFYSRYPTPAKGKEFSAKNEYHKVYYHKLGTPQSKDILIYEDPKNKLHYHNVGLTEDDKYLVLTKSSGTDGFETYYKAVDLKKGGFTCLFSGFANKSSIVDHKDGKFYVYTDIAAPNYQLVAIDPAKPQQENWTPVIPESKNLLDGVNIAGGKIFASYLQDVSTHIYVYDYNGKKESEVKMPGIGTAAGFGGNKEDTETFYQFTSFNYPTTIFRYDIKTGKSDVFFKPETKFNPEDFEVKQVWYTSKDGNKNPMFVVYKKGIKMDGRNPTLLYAYGGFNANITPSFSVNQIPLLENGGIYCVATLRGGGEYGEKWHQAGMLLNKQNVFDDFIAAAEYLIAQKYTSKDYLAISGRSNGGLLVGACMTQRPDLYKVCFPGVGVMDMMKFQKFTVGFGWVPEYGSSDNKEHYKYLYGYSPVHNVKETEYPATMVTTADHDDRVVPAHSFKYIATLQEKQKGKAPCLIRIDVNAGHGAGKPTSKVIEEVADMWSFMFFNMNKDVVYN
ncbi:MAG TPA: prolyl oligopeptidase family serine peptidase [Flavobacteriales bacterium]|nr:prolyl oligopeptidase family serine peptidase [Flavobacteriales bacterium]